MSLENGVVLPPAKRAKRGKREVWKQTSLNMADGFAAREVEGSHAIQEQSPIPVDARGGRGAVKKGAAIRRPRVRQTG